MRAGNHNHIGEDQQFNTTVSQTNWGAVISGATVQYDFAAENNLGELGYNHPGMSRICILSASAAGILHKLISGSAAFGQLPFGGFSLTTVVLLQNLSAAGQEFFVRVGVGLSSSNAVPSIGTYFLYNHGVNGGAWTPVIRRAGTGSETRVPNVSIPVSVNTWYKLNILALPNYQSVIFSVNDTVIGNIATDSSMPQKGDKVGLFNGMYAVSGATQRCMFVDMIDYVPNFGIGR
jgi:hypothetical protein